MTTFSWRVQRRLHHWIWWVSQAEPGEEGHLGPQQWHISVPRVLLLAELHLYLISHSLDFPFWTVLLTSVSYLRAIVVSSSLSACIPSLFKLPCPPGRLSCSTYLTHASGLRYSDCTVGNPYFNESDNSAAQGFLKSSPQPRTSKVCQEQFPWNKSYLSLSWDFWLGKVIEDDL